MQLNKHCTRCFISLALNCCLTIVLNFIAEKIFTLILSGTSCLLCLNPPKRIRCKCC